MEDVISKSEGTYNGKNRGYSVEYANGKYSPYKADIATLKISELRKYQRGMLAVQKRKGIPPKKRSSAVGRYQFMGYVIDDLKRRYKNFFVGDPVFSPAFQDKLMEFFLDKEVHYKDWRNGKISDKKFATYLSYKWASFPYPKTGRSYYPKQRAHIKLSEVYALLKKMRKVMGETIDAPNISVDRESVKSKKEENVKTKSHSVQKLSNLVDKEALKPSVKDASDEAVTKLVYLQ